MSDDKKVSLANAGVDLNRIANRFDCTELSIASLLSGNRHDYFYRLSQEKAYVVGKAFRLASISKDTLYLPVTDEFQELISDEGVADAGVYDGLVRYGMIPESEPLIPKKYTKSFILGYLNGGGIYAYKDYAVVIVTGPYKWVNWIVTRGPGGLTPPVKQEITTSRTQNDTTARDWIGWLNDGK